jgi:hypothetical protein
LVCLGLACQLYVHTRKGFPNVRVPRDEIVPMAVRLFRQTVVKS